MKQQQNNLRRTGSTQLQGAGNTQRGSVRSAPRRSTGTVPHRSADRMRGKVFHNSEPKCAPAGIIERFNGWRLGISIDGESVLKGVVIGALMILVPGLLFTNAMRDIIFGDTNSGVNRIVQMLLVAAAIALGTGAGWNLAGILWGTPISVAPLVHPVWLQCLASFIGCYGFSILFNIHGPGGLLCALGGMLSWGTYLLITSFGGDEATGYFGAAVVAAAYSEIMARIRKYAAISYLVISIFPLIPGAAIYYATNHLVRGNGEMFAQKGMQAITIAGAIAVGILMVSTIVRLWGIKRLKKT